MVFGVLLVESIEELLGDGLFGFVFDLAKVGVGGGHGDIHEERLAQVVGERHVEDLGVIEFAGVLLEDEERHEGDGMAVSGDALGFRDAAEDIAGAGNAVERVNRLEEVDEALFEGIHIGGSMPNGAVGSLERAGEAFRRS